MNCACSKHWQKYVAYLLVVSSVKSVDSFITDSGIDVKVNAAEKLLLGVISTAKQTRSMRLLSEWT